MFPVVTNTKINGVPAYATNDLFAPHPTREDMWKIVGRADDQIVLSNSEKVGICYWYLFLECGSWRDPVLPVRVHRFPDTRSIPLH